MFTINPLYLTDGYKVGHKAMLAPGTTRLYGTWIPRSTKHAPKGITKIVSFGQQLAWKYIHDVFEEHFFNLNLSGALKFGEDMNKYLGMEYNDRHFLELHHLGYLPLKVKALPEGIETDPNIPHMTFINTVDGFAWLTLYMETMVSNLAWKASTAATIAKLYRRQAEEWVTKTDPKNLWLVDYMCHDFSARGLSGPYDMISVGLGHATSFRGSDTLAAIPAARYYYNEPNDEVIINSVNASEHSVSTTKIFTVGENQMIADWIKLFPKGILSIVSDTFDLWKLITEYLPANKEAIMARDGKLVIRPDSGDPVDIICGVSTKYEDLTKWFPEGDVLPKYFKDSLLEEVKENTPHGEYGVTEYTQIYLVRGKLYKATIHNIQWNRYDKQYYFIEMYEEAKITVEELDWKPSDKGVIELLWDIFGGTVNEQGYKVLDPHIGAIYGDSITPDRQRQIYERLAAKGFASTNIVLGVGSFTYQYITRDTLGFAAKGAWFEVKNGDSWTDDDGNIHNVKKSYNIYKDPVTDDGTKKSLKGLLQVQDVSSAGDYQYADIKVFTECTPKQEEVGLLQVIYENGKFYNQTTFKEVRDRLLKI
jgi:nicotinamide phosphoribosyltransferase